MFNSIVSLLKSFLEKRLIPTILSIILTCVGLYLTPETNSWLAKLGKPFYCIFLFCVSFVSVNAIIILCKKIQNFFRRIRHNMRDNAEIFENLWSYIDSLSDEDYTIIVEFLKSKNSPITKPAFKHEYGNSFLNSKHVIKSKHSSPIGFEVNLYILKDDFYKLLLDSVKIYQKIDHFKRLTLDDLEAKSK